MFTGLIEEIGRVSRNMPAAGKLSILAKTVLEGMKTGDSIAVNGACLTVTDFEEHSFTADVTPETIRRSGLGQLHSGEPVNLERPVAANGRFGGHLVTGHVDGIGRISGRTEEGNAVCVEIRAPAELLELIVEKGSVAVDGISLTVSSVDLRAFGVSVIPHTGSHTTLLSKQIGDPVNLETDLIGKYVQKFLRKNPSPSDMTVELLRQNGF
ncbi:riboflavin synthase (alpha subunit) [Ruminococcaceae bacterium BL-6]|nr:riboflavin synthase (alpha subunit) [Ruminococcaceae bacterium BL-6]